MKPIAFLPFALLLALAGCKEPETATEVIRPAQVWTINSYQSGNGTTYSGEIKARYEADLSFRVGGKVTTRQVDTGDTVKAGQVLAELDTADLNLNLASSKAALAAAEADYVNAKAELVRVSELRRKQFIGQASLDAAQAAHDAAQARVTSAKAQLKLSGNQAAYTELKADQTGIITAVYAEAGQVVAAGTPVVHIAYAGEREVQIRVGENTARTLAAGTVVNIRLWSQAESEFQGKVREVSPATDATRSFLIKISLLNPPGDLRLGVTADVSLPGTGAQDSSWIPASALFQQSQQTAVWVLGQNHQVSIQPVSILAFHDDGVTISSLPVGTQIIAAGVHKLSSGQTISPVPYDGKAGS
ncbi:MAG: efflux RND transporter periplasmic adaptor subunit [Thiothrix sp.]